MSSNKLSKCSFFYFDLPYKILNTDWWLKMLLQEENFKRHRKCARAGQHPLGVSSVSATSLGRLLLLRLERSEVHRQGCSTASFFSIVLNTRLNVNRLKKIFCGSGL